MEKGEVHMVSQKADENDGAVVSGAESIDGTQHMVSGGNFNHS